MGYKSSPKKEKRRKGDFPKKFTSIEIDVSDEEIEGMEVEIEE